MLFEDQKNQDKSLEIFTRQHHKDFEGVEKVDPDLLWGKINSSIPQQTNSGQGWNLQIGRNWKWSIAAAIALMITAGIQFWPHSTGDNHFSIAEFFPEFADEEEQYKQLIKEKEETLNLEALDPAYFQDIFQEMELLEDIHQQFRAELPAYADQERVVEILLKYYEQKIKMLDRLSREIQKQKNKKDDEILL